MMRAFIHCDSTGYPCNTSAFTAFVGLREMGHECIFFQRYEELLANNHSKEEIIVSGIGMIRRRLQDFGIACNGINYPEELGKYLGRRIWKLTINEIANMPAAWPVFVKSVEGKRLSGRVVNGTHDLVGCGCLEENYKVLCSEPVHFIAEWRVFVRYGKVLDVRPYKGDWKVHYDPNVIERAIKDYTTAPNAYGIDFGVTSNGETLLVEVNEGYALGCYGLFPHLYAKLILTRWAELTGTSDEYGYI